MEVDAALRSSWEQLFCSELVRTSSSKGPSCLCPSQPSSCPFKKPGALGVATRVEV